MLLALAASTAQSSATVSTFLETFESVLRDVFLGIARAVPKILLSILIIVISLVVIKYINKLITFVVEKTRFEEYVRKHLSANIPLTKLFILIADIGIVLVAIAGILNIVAPELVPVYRQGLEYFSRLVSVILLSLVSVIGLNAIISLIKIEEKIRSFIVLIVFLLIFAFLVDLTALSNTVKAAIVSGISIGIGIAIGAFAIWFLFGEYVERLVKSKEEEAKSRSGKQ
ncbi:MAG: hypothetical protein GXO23_01970 [Crenarchaeota archaeon]|nr:hypothetical protein [Thermoproteota archaeon]